jgi:hypothetical protein
VSHSKIKDLGVLQPEAARDFSKFPQWAVPKLTICRACYRVSGVRGGVQCARALHGSIEAFDMSPG